MNTYTNEQDWNGAKWITSPHKTMNTSALTRYSVEADFCAEGKIGIVFSARNKDNYTAAEVEHGTVVIAEHCDNARGNGIPSREVCGEMTFSDTADRIHIEIAVDLHRVSVAVNGRPCGECELPSDIPNQPRKRAMMNVGVDARGCSADVYGFKAVNANTGVVYIDTCFGSMKNEFELISPVPSVTVRRRFTPDKKIASASLYASAKGFYNAYINGSRVGNIFFAPGFTDYRLRIPYQTYDVTDLLRDGENELIAVVAKGYYSGFCGYSGAQVYGEQSSFIGKLVITYTDGTEEIIVTDKAWEYAKRTPFCDADYLDGEIYDARIKIGEWVKCGVEEWNYNVMPTNGTLDNVSFSLTRDESSAKIRETLKPVLKPSEPKRGCFVYDFGQNIVGTIRLRLKGKRGTSIKICYGEMTDRCGDLYTANLRTAASTDIYTLSGEGEEEFIPSFTSHGFRYVQISGNGFELADSSIVKGIEGLVINNLGDATGGFECSNEDINKLWKNIQWGLKGNSLLVLTDCPQRNERMGWTGDAQVFIKTGAYCMYMKELTEKWLHDLADAQLMYNRDGAVPDTAPLGGDNRRDGCGGWGDAAVIVPWELYMAYGDISILEEHYPMMQKWIKYQSRSERQNYGERTVNGKSAPSDLASIPYIQTQQRRGDHLAYDESTPFILSATAYAARCAYIMAETAELLGKKRDAKKYRERFDNIRRAFNEAWVNEDGSIGYWGEMSTDRGHINKTYHTDLGDGKNRPSQTAYALAIDFGLIDKDKQTYAGECLKNAIERSGGLLSVGFLGISHLIPALEKSGHIEEAFKLLEQTDNPSWLYSVKNGATTIWERWNSYIAETGEFGDANMNSFNHYAYGAIGEWLMGSVAGINAEEAGYKKIRLTPHWGGSLTYAKAWHKSPYGMIKSSWKINSNELVYECEIPDNTTAQLYLLSQKYELGSGRHKFTKNISELR